MTTSYEMLHEAATVVRQLDVKVKNVEELRQFLRELPGVANPDVEVARSVRTLGVTVVSVTLGVAGLATTGLVSAFSASAAGIDSGVFIAALALVWGAAALIVC